MADIERAHNFLTIRVWKLKFQISWVIESGGVDVLLKWLEEAKNKFKDSTI